MYRFLLSPRWLGLALLMVLAATTMVGLGLWQLDRYHQRSAVNARIDAAGTATPVAIEQVLATPHTPGQAGAAPASEVEWTMVSVTGEYDPAHEILARIRTVEGRVGFEVLTPLRLAGGPAVLVDRGWIPPSPQGANALPTVPPAPVGAVTVVGQVHAPESRAGAAIMIDGRLQVRRIAPAKLAANFPYPLYGAYLTMRQQTPAADPSFVAISASRVNAVMNAGYVVQWWLFAVLTLVGYGYLARNEARSRSGADHEPAPLVETGVESV